ncbi:hypothetical protein [Chitiniphilus shinanonensis]|uniref:hypothetical protein n=1 Tax=Chitiniphilus shinanonensis TaxID=553088 RepID=UPI0030571307
MPKRLLPWSAPRPFDAGERAALLRRLSDLDAGSPRQWLWLELAAGTGTGETPRTRRIGRLLALGGPWLAWRRLRAAGLPGLTLYARQIGLLRARLRHIRQDGLLCVLCLPALLAGFERLPATQAMAAWLVTLCGLVWQAWRQPGAPATSLPPDEGDGEEELPGPEASLGLAGMLIGAGQSPLAAQRLVTQLRAAPDATLPALLAALPALAPAPPTRATRRWLAALHWLAATLPPAWLLGALPAPWGLGAAVAYGVLLAAKASRGTALLVAVATLLAHALGRLGHWL